MSIKGQPRPKLRTQVLFIVPERRVDEYLGVGYLSAALRLKGVGTETVQWALSGARETVEKLLESESDLRLVGIPWLYIFSEPRVVEVARLIKSARPDVKVVVGGHPATFEYVRILKSYPEIDFVVRGEGDHSIVELYHAVRDGATPVNVRGVAYRDSNGLVITTSPRPQMPDLDEIPDPARDTLEHVIGHYGSADRVLARMIGSRGCYARCEFCSMVSFYSLDGHGMLWRPRSPEKMFDEIVQLVSRYGVRKFWFADDEFVGPPRVGVPRLLQFAELLTSSALDIEFGFDARANGITAFTQVQLAYLRRAGLRVVAMGLESGSQGALDRMNKGMRVESNREAVTRLREASIDYRYGFIMYDEQTTLRDLRDNINFLRFAEPHKICNTGAFRLLNAEFPEVGTPLFKRYGLETHTVNLKAAGDFPRLDESQLGYNFACHVVSHYRRLLLKLACEEVEPTMIPRRENESPFCADVWYGVNSDARNVAVMQAFLGCHEWLLDRIEGLNEHNDGSIYDALVTHFRMALQDQHGLHLR